MYTNYSIDFFSSIIFKIVRGTIMKRIVVCQACRTVRFYMYLNNVRCGEHRVHTYIYFRYSMLDLRFRYTYFKHRTRIKNQTIYLSFNFVEYYVYIGSVI